MDNELKLNLMNTSYQLVEMEKCLEWKWTHKLENKKERDTPNL